MQVLCRSGEGLGDGWGRVPEPEELAVGADGDVVARLYIASYGGCGCQDVDVVAQTGDLPVAHGEHDDVGKRELASGRAGPESFLLDDTPGRVNGNSCTASTAYTRLMSSTDWLTAAWR
jgi:hypothetical protein